MHNVQPETHQFTDGPNNKRLPVLVYRGAMADEKDKTDAFEQTYKKNNWSSTWIDTIYTYQHFHTNAHEALGLAQGSVRIELGGSTGITLELEAGDLIVLPAGTIHKRLSRGRVVVVGAYPEGQQNYNMHKDVTHPHEAEVEKVMIPACDPLYGKYGPLTRLWKTS